MLTTIDRSKLALCPLCSMPAVQYARHHGEPVCARGCAVDSVQELWISRLRLQGRGDRAEAGGDGK